MAVAPTVLPVLTPVSSFNDLRLQPFIHSATADGCDVNDGSNSNSNSSVVTSPSGQPPPPAPLVTATSPTTVQHGRQLGNWQLQQQQHQQRWPTNCVSANDSSSAAVTASYQACGTPPPGSHLGSGRRRSMSDSSSSNAGHSSSSNAQTVLPRRLPEMYTVQAPRAPASMRSSMSSNGKMLQHPTHLQQQQPCCEQRARQGSQHAAASALNARLAELRALRGEPPRGAATAETAVHAAAAGCWPQQQPDSCDALLLDSSSSISSSGGLPYYSSWPQLLPAAGAAATGNTSVSYLVGAGATLPAAQFAPLRMQQQQQQRRKESTSATSSGAHSGAHIDADGQARTIQRGLAGGSAASSLVASSTGSAAVLDDVWHHHHHQHHHHHHQQQKQQHQQRRAAAVAAVGIGDWPPVAAGADDRLTAAEERIWQLEKLQELQQRLQEELLELLQ